MSTNTFRHESTSEEEEGLLSEVSYPPAPQSASQTVPPEGSNTLDEISIQFFFRPKYPLTLSSEAADAMGLLPRSQEEAIQTAMEAFPVLQRFEPERILFLVHSPNSIVGLASLLSSSWKGLRQKPPAGIRVEVADEPGDL